MLSELEMLATREARQAYKEKHGAIPPALLAERSRPWLVAPVLFPLVERLSRGKIGWCNASEYALRLMAWVDTGHVYGERSISRRLRVEAKRKLLHRERIPAGGRFHRTAQRTRNGTTINRFPTEKERREELARAKHARRQQRKIAKARARAAKIIARPSSSPAPAFPREMPRTGIVPATREHMVLPQGFLEAPAPTSAECAAEFEALRAIQLEAARALTAQWEAEEAPS
jgi:hypothetical protein